jgi:hypothetical protein
MELAGRAALCVLFREVHPKLQAYAQVVAHASYFTTHNALVECKGIWREFELVSVNVELLAEDCSVFRSCRYKRLCDMHAVFA